MTSTQDLIERADTAIIRARIDYNLYVFDVEETDSPTIYGDDLLSRTRRQSLAERILAALRDAGLDIDDPQKFVTDLFFGTIIEQPATVEEQPTANQHTVNTTPVDATSIIQTLRAAGRTVRHIAQTLGVAASTIYRWVKGTYRPNTRNAARLATLNA